MEPFFHLATERLPCGAGLSGFPTGNPARDALASNFEQVDAAHADLSHEIPSLFAITGNHPGNFQLVRQSIPEGTLIGKPTTGS